MSAAVPTSEGDRTGRDRSFLSALAVLAASLLLLGGLGFGYLRANSPLSLLAGSDRPIAAATVFVPSQAPFTFSLLTKPERLISLQQAVVKPDRREQARREVAEVQQRLLQSTGLDYERDIQPWMGEEITYAYTDVDLDRDTANGQQPGYFLAIEIAPGKQLQAQSFLQLFWQQQSLVGNSPQSQKISGVRVLSGTRDRSPSRAANLSAATALIGNQFVMFSNDLRVIRRSIRAAQTAQNLAQNLAYRQTVNTLPSQRIGLAYLDTALLNQDPSSATRRNVAIGIGLTRTGLVADIASADLANAGLAATRQREAATTNSIEPAQSTDFLESTRSEPLRYLPAKSELAVVGDSFSALRSGLLASGVSEGVLPEFLQLGQSLPGQSLPEDPWQPLATQYALAQVGGGRSYGGGAYSGSGTSSRDWILAVKRTPETEAAVRSLNQAAAKAGYSVVPVPLGPDTANSRSDSDVDSSFSESLFGSEATAWTRFKVGRRRQAGSGLETELLGLHLQRGGCEIFASSLAAMNSAIAAPSDPLLTSPQFLQAIDPLETPNDGYLYLDWPIAASTIGQVLPAVSAFESAARPLTDHIHTISATRRGDQASFSIQLTEPSFQSVGGSQR